MKIISGLAEVKLANFVPCSQRSVIRAYRGIGTEFMIERIRRAALALGITPPPAKSDEKKAA